METILRGTIYQQGVSLIELMISLTIVAIVLISVGPNVQGILVQNRIVSELNELSGIIQYARNNAIDEQVATVVCPSQDFANCTTDWNDPKIVFTDLNNNGIRGTGEDLLVASTAIGDVNYMTGPGQKIVFQASGAADIPATLLLCHSSKSAKYARALSVSLQGRVKMSRDVDDNGIYEDEGGAALACL
jgi:type IV fimbrial biogenesis protein FimT